MAYNPLHQAVDQLSPDQAKALLVVVTSMLDQPVAAEPANGPIEVLEPGQPRLPFTAAGSWVIGSRR